MKNKKYYIYITGWNGMKIEEVGKRKYEKVYSNLEKAKEEIKRLWEEEIECDEGVYLYHNGVLEEIEYNYNTFEIIDRQENKL